MKELVAKCLARALVLCFLGLTLSFSSGEKPSDIDYGIHTFGIHKRFGYYKSDPNVTTYHKYTVSLSDKQPKYDVYQLDFTSEKPRLIIDYQELGTVIGLEFKEDMWSTKNTPFIICREKCSLDDNNNISISIGKLTVMKSRDEAKNSVFPQWLHLKTPGSIEIYSAGMLTFKGAVESTKKNVRFNIPYVVLADPDMDAYKRIGNEANDTTIDGVRYWDGMRYDDILWAKDKEQDSLLINEGHIRASKGKFHFFRILKNKKGSTIIANDLRVGLVEHSGVMKSKTITIYRKVYGKGEIIAESKHDTTGYSKDLKFKYQSWEKTLKL